MTSRGRTNPADEFLIGRARSARVPLAARSTSGTGKSVPPVAARVRPTARPASHVAERDGSLSATGRGSRADCLWCFQCLQPMTNEQKAIVDKRVRLIMSQCQAHVGLYSFSSPQLSVPQIMTDLDKDSQVETLESLHFYSP